MRLFLLVVDNVVVILVSLLILCFVPLSHALKYLIGLVMIPVLIFAGIHLRFWRSPKRKFSADPKDIVSPADGRVIYINRIAKYAEITSVKKGRISVLTELTSAELSPIPCWHIGINMTPFDVHKNCSPISGKIKLSKHNSGKFLSLKNPSAVHENERHTYVIENDNDRVAVVQIASRRVRRIDSYKKEGDLVGKGEWLGMIRFGSQVDVFLPIDCKLLIREGQQVYAASSVIAEFLPNKGNVNK